MAYHNNLTAAAEYFQPQWSGTDTVLDFSWSSTEPGSQISGSRWKYQYLDQNTRSLITVPDGTAVRRGHGLLEIIHLFVLCV